MTSSFRSAPSFVSDADAKADCAGVPADRVVHFEALSGDIIQEASAFRATVGRFKIQQAKSMLDASDKERVDQCLDSALSTLDEAIRVLRQSQVILAECDSLVSQGCAKARVTRGQKRVRDEENTFLESTSVLAPWSSDQVAAPWVNHEVSMRRKRRPIPRCLLERIKARQIKALAAE